MVPTFETEGPGRGILKGNKRTLQYGCVVTALELHLHQAQQGCRGNRQTQTTAHSWWAGTFLQPFPPSQFCPGSFSTVKTNLTAIAEPDRSLAKFPLGVTQLSFLKGMIPIFLSDQGEMSLQPSVCKNKQRDERRKRGEALLQ